MDTIISLLPSLIGLIGGVVGSGPVGLIAGGIGILGMLGAGLWIYNKYRNYIFNKVNDQEHQQSAVDQGNVILQNQAQSSEDQVTMSQSEKDKAAAKSG